MKPEAPAELTSIKRLVALSMMNHLGSNRIAKLSQIAGSADQIFELSYQQITSLYGIGKKIAREILDFDQWDRVNEIIENSYRYGASLMTLEDDDYPSLLKEIYDPPLLLWIKGSREVLQATGISVVGTRSCSSYGHKMARQLVEQLVERKITIVSGLAYGIDTTAHKTTVEQGGRTIAVLGSGIDIIYPSRNSSLADKIIDTGGAVISEFPLGSKPDAGNFPVRNRIVSGLSMGTLVVESGLKGGSMITINAALNQNREVFAVPHPLDGTNQAGCNTLIRDGLAKLVINADDIIGEIGHLEAVVEVNKASSSHQEPNWKKCNLKERQIKICTLLTGKSMHIDELAEKLDMPTSSLLAEMLTLEMMDCVEQQAGKLFQLK